MRRLRERGHVAYFAGGCVRDELLGLAPQDYDVATDATPSQMRSILGRVNEVGAAFGVALVHQNGVTVEIATFREETGYSDRRRPDEVRFSTSERDARRRDFTINAIFLDPLAEPAHDPAASAARILPGPEDGRVVDYVGGLADIEARVLRAVGDPEARLAEDHLRSLRAARLGARLRRFGFRVDDSTAAAIRAHAGELSGVSRERVGDEVRRMFLDSSAPLAAELMEAFGLAAPVLLERPPVQKSPRMAPPPTLGGLTLPHGLDDAQAWTARLSAWLLDRWEVTPASGEGVASRVEPVVARIRRALCLTNDERQDLRQALQGIVLLEQNWLGAAIAGQKRMAAARWFEPSLALVDARHPEVAAKVRGRVAELATTPGGLTPQAFLTGDDLLRLGVRQGPRVGEWLERLYDAQLEGQVNSPEEAIAIVQAWIGGGSGRES